MDWEQAYRDHHTDVFRYLYGRCGRSRELARDLAQDVFVRGMRSERLFRYDDGRGVLPWLLTIARNLLADHFRRATHRPETLVAEVLDETAVPSAESLALDGLDAAVVLAAVARLEPEAREAIVLSYWGGWPDARIGERLGMNPRTVITRRYRARQALKPRLAEVA
jgi:RNA polymerase sigma-70 factor (ECF subfamily)